MTKCDLLQFKAAEPIHKCGDEPGGLFGIVEGRVELRLIMHGVDPALSYIAGPGFWTGDIAAAIGRRPQIAIVAGSDCKVLHLPRIELLRLARDASACRYLLDFFARNCDKSISVVDALRREDAAERVAAMLALLSDDLPEDANVIAASQWDLAALTKLSRGTVNVALRELESSGLIRRRYASVEVVNPGALRRLLSQGRKRSIGRSRTG